MPEETKQEHRSDHDLLITLHTKMDRVQLDVRDINENLSRRVAILENDMLKKIDFKDVNDDKEKRIRRLERYGSVAIGALWLWEFIKRTS